MPPSPSTLFPPAPTTVPTARRAAEAQRRAYPAVLISSDATALLVLSEGGAFEVDVAEAPDTIAGYVARPPATVVTLTNGLVRAYSRMYPEGIDLGSARAVFPSQDPRRVWLTGVIDGESAVKEMPVDGTVPPQLATGFIALPDNSSVVGVAGGELVLSVRTDLSEPYELVTWDPATRTTEFLARGNARRCRREPDRVDTQWVRVVRDLCAPRRRHAGGQRDLQPRPERAGHVLAGRPFPCARDHGKLAGRRCRRGRRRCHRGRPRPRPAASLGAPRPRQGPSPRPTSGRLLRSR